MQSHLKMTLAEIEKIRASKEFAELRRKVQEIDEARDAGHASYSALCGAAPLLVLGA